MNLMNPNEPNEGSGMSVNLKVKVGRVECNPLVDRGKGFDCVQGFSVGSYRGDPSC